MFEIKGRQSVSQQIVDDIIALVNSGKLMTGSELPKEQELADKYQVSRNTVREALRTLEAYGIVETSKRMLPKIVNRNIQAATAIAAIVSPENKQYSSEVQQMRLLFECGLAVQICDNISDKDIAELEHINGQIASTTAVSKLAKLDYDFHMILIGAAGNKLIKALYSSLAGTMISILEEGKNLDEGIRAALFGHKQIIDALKKRSSDDFARCIRDHFVFSMTRIGK